MHTINECLVNAAGNFYVLEVWPKIYSFAGCKCLDGASTAYSRVDSSGKASALLKRFLQANVSVQIEHICDIGIVSASFSKGVQCSSLHRWFAIC